MDAAYCVICNGREKASRQAQDAETRERERELLMDMVKFKAKYDGKCPVCEEEIATGEIVGWKVTLNGERVVHSECLDAWLDGVS